MPDYHLAHEAKGVVRLGTGGRVVPSLILAGCITRTMLHLLRTVVGTPLTISGPGAAGQESRVQETQSDGSARALSTAVGETLVV